MNHAQVRNELEQAIDLLSTAWLSHHAEAYLPLDAKAPYTGLLQRITPPARVSSGDNELPKVDPFFKHSAGGRAFWLLGGQRIGNYCVCDDVDNLKEYYEWRAYALGLADEYKKLTGKHHPMLPALWTLEAPPPYLLKGGRK